MLESSILYRIFSLPDLLTCPLMLEGGDTGCWRVGRLERPERLSSTPLGLGGFFGQ